MTVNELTRQLVRKRANYLCEYCHSPERISTSRFTIDHIQPRSLGGSDDPDNLALACSCCNQRRYNFIVDQDGTDFQRTPTIFKKSFTSLLINPSSSASSPLALTGTSKFSFLKYSSSWIYNPPSSLIVCWVGSP